MTKAKHLHGSEKTDAVKTSFENKLKNMSKTLSLWRKTGQRDSTFFPESLTQLKSWEAPQEGIFKWTSNNITKREGDYSKQVDRYWSLREKAAKIPKAVDDVKGEESRYKRENIKLTQQIAQITWDVMDLRDELARIDPNNNLLARVSFP